MPKIPISPKFKIPQNPISPQFNAITHDMF